MYDSSARPWQWWDDVYRALAGGDQQMAFTGRIEAQQIPADVYALEATWPPGAPHNPSVAVHNGRLFVIVRVLGPDAQNVLGEIVDRKFVNTRTLVDQGRGVTTRGHEDCRLFVLDGQLTVAANVCNVQTVGYGQPRMTVARLVDDGIVAGPIQQSRRGEKNWMPVVDQVEGVDRLRFVYSVAPLIVLGYDRASGTVRPGLSDLPVTIGTVRGGSQLVPYGDGWIAVVHQVSTASGDAKRRHDRDMIYVHHFAKFDHALTEVRLGVPFYFQHAGAIEFCAGLVEWQGKFILSFGADDKRPCIAEVERSVVADMIAAAVPFQNVHVDRTAVTVVPPATSASPANALDPTAVLDPRSKQWGCLRPDQVIPGHSQDSYSALGFFVPADRSKK